MRFLIILFISITFCGCKKDDFKKLGFENEVNEAIELQVNAQCTLYSLVILHDHLRTTNSDNGVKNCFVRNTDTNGGAVIDSINFSSNDNCYATDPNHTSGLFVAKYNSVPFDTVRLNLNGIVSNGYVFEGFLNYVPNPSFLPKGFTIDAKNIKITRQNKVSFIKMNLIISSYSQAYYMSNGTMTSTGDTKFSWDVYQELKGTMLENISSYVNYRLSFYQGRAKFTTNDEDFKMIYGNVGDDEQDALIVVENKDNQRQGINQPKI